MMDDEILEQYREAGTIAARILSEGAKGIRVDASYLEVVEFIETLVAEE